LRGHRFRTACPRVAARALIAPLTLTFTQLLWFVVPTFLTRFDVLQLPASYFSAGALAFMHCAQYLWVTTHYARGENTGARARFSFARYYALLVVGGLALFIPGPWVASRLLGRDFVESFMIFMALVNLHHFILDGAVWKLRDGRIARLLLGTHTPAVHDPMPDAPSPRHHLGWLFGSTRPARLTLYAFAAAILIIGALDQWQFFRTRRSADPDTLAVAEVVNPRDSRVYFRRAQLAVEAANWPDARAQLEKILALNPRNAPAQHLLGELLFKSGDIPAALAHYDRMAGLFRPDPGIALNRGLLAAQLERADASQRLAEALELSPHRLVLHTALAEAYVRNNDLPRAIAQYELFARLYSENPAPETNGALYIDACLNLGELHARRDAFAEAERWWQRAAGVAVTLDHLPQAADALNRLANLQAAQGRAAEAADTRSLVEQAAAAILSSNPGSTRNPDR
jgi:tetratricopeptide (TPR) repeat protein